MEEELLTTEELLLLELLTYYVEPNGTTIYESDVLKPGMTIEDYLNDNSEMYINPFYDYGAGMTMFDMNDIRKALLNNKKLRDIVIVETHTDDMEGKSILLINEKSGESIVAFRGTEEPEWRDNFYGGGSTDAADGVSTPQQVAALEWYKEIYTNYDLEQYYISTVGHSKGGNKAVYTALLDSTVDRCLSCDGQGFSDEFLIYYADIIVDREGIIENHNVNYDFVNILLNTIGKTTYYKPQNVNSFIEFHSPNSFFEIDKYGNVYIKVDDRGRPEEIEIIDKFLNSYLRSMDGDEKEDALELIGDAVEMSIGGASKISILIYLLNNENRETTTYFLEYLSRYLKRKPELGEALQVLLDEGTMEFVSDIVGIVQLLNSYNEEIGAMGIGTIATVGLETGGNVADILNSVELTDNSDLNASEILQHREELFEALCVIHNIFEDISNINIQWLQNLWNVLSNVINWFSSIGKKKEFFIERNKMRRAQCALYETEEHMKNANKKMFGINKIVGMSNNINNCIEEIRFKLAEESRECESLASALLRINEVYTNNETAMTNG